MSHIAFTKALTRSEQLLTAALLTHDAHDYERYIADANAIAAEWSIGEELRASILEAANENSYMGRVLE